jgi:hypothetical protein
MFVVSINVRGRRLQSRICSLVLRRVQPPIECAGEPRHPAADRLFGAYYHWCALLCGFSEAALDHALLVGPQLAALRLDIEATLPQLRSRRQVLVVIPASRELNPRIVDLLRDHTTIERLRRLHSAFGEAVRDEQSAREFDLLNADD